MTSPEFLIGSLGGEAIIELLARPTKPLGQVIDSFQKGTGLQYTTDILFILLF
jgi:hypothetical protein